MISEIRPAWPEECTARFGHLLKATPLPGGGNNRLYVARTDGGQSLVIKCYWTSPLDPRNRLKTEFEALRFLRRHGVAWVPEAFVADERSSSGFYQYIKGSPPPRSQYDRLLSQFIGFQDELLRLSRMPEAEVLGKASESCITPDLLARALKDRLSRLESISDPLARKCVADLIIPWHSRTSKSFGQWLAETKAAPESLVPGDIATLSQSDFGLHNCLLTDDGTLVLVDFEYFGWDSLSKVASDLLLHPAASLSTEEMHMLLTASENSFGEIFSATLPRLLPLHATLWACRLLNEFLPVSASRRAFAKGDEALSDESRSRQLEKISSLFKRCTIALELLAR